MPQKKKPVPEWLRAEMFKRGLQPGSVGPTGACHSLQLLCLIATWICACLVRQTIPSCSVSMLLPRQCAWIAYNQNYQKCISSLTCL